MDAVGSAARLGYLLHDLEPSADGRLLYIADRSNDTIRTLDLETNAVATLVGPAAGLSGPGGLHRVDDILYIADTFNHCIRRVDPDGMISTVAGQCGVPGFAGDGGDSREALLDRPYGIDLDAGGNLYIADTKNQRIRVVYR